MTPNRIRIYLAGGMRSGWQKKVIERLKDRCLFFNPEDHGLANAKEYTQWDLYFIKQSDIVFAYQEDSNPSGYGIALEIGYAKALNKTIILVDERSQIDSSFSNYFKIVRESSNIVFDNIELGIDYLERFLIYQD